MEQLLSNLEDFGIANLPDLLMPVAVLIIGWLSALVAGYVVRAALRRTRLDQRIARRVLGEEKARTVDTARWTGKAVYYFVLAFTLLAFLQTASLTAATKPIEAMLAAVLEYLPRAVGAGVILLVAWLAATLTRRVLSAGMTRFDIDRKVAEESAAPDVEGTRKPVAVGKAIAETAYWLVLLVFVPAILGALELGGLLGPVQSMVDEVLGFIPNLASAGLILLVGWLVARIAQRLATNVLSGVGLDRLSDRVGAAKVLGERKLSSLMGLVVYALILLPVAVATLNALQLEAVTAPASQMLQAFFAALPALFGATLLVAVAYFAARLLSGVVIKLLQGIGFDHVLSRMGIAQRHLGRRTPSGLVGGVVIVAVLLFAGIEAARMLGFAAVAELGSEFALLGGRVLLGLLIFGFGMFLADLGAKGVRRSGISNGRLLSTVTRAAILVLAGAMALRQMGIADEIIELAFGLALGAVAVATALAFGLGGREAAAKALEDMRARLQSRSQTQHPPESQEAAE